MKKGICLLCGNYGELATKSHIIPKFMYKGMEDSRNKIGQSILRDNIKIETEIDYRYFEKDVLCLNCETVKLSQLDDYGNRILFGDKKIDDLFNNKILEYPDKKVCVLENFDYTKLKLFLLSILWRSHISKHTFFDNINLFQRATAVREAILTGDVGVCDEVKISILGLMFNRNKLYKVVAKPRHLFTDSLDIYSFVIYGIGYNFIYRDELNSFHLGENTLQAGKQLQIPFFLGADAAHFFRAFAFPTG